MKAIKLKIPTRLIDLKSEQLIFISRLFMIGYSETEFLLKAFLFLSGLKLFERQPAADGARWYKHRSRRIPFIIDTEILSQMTEKCRYLLDADEINPMRWMNFARARHFRMYNATFEEYLMAENFYFAYIQTNNETHLNNLISVLYRRPWHRWNSDKIQARARHFRKIEPAVKNTVFMWYVGFRSLVPKRCPNLFSGNKSSSEFNIRNYINGMVHQLSGGNITLNKSLLKQPVWDALDELEQRALDAVKLEESYNTKT